MSLLFLPFYYNGIWTLQKGCRCVAKISTLDSPANHFFCSYTCIYNHAPIHSHSLPSSSRCIHTYTDKYFFLIIWENIANHMPFTPQSSSVYALKFRMFEDGKLYITGHSSCWRLYAKYKANVSVSSFMIAAVGPTSEYNLCKLN